MTDLAMTDPRQTAETAGDSASKETWSTPVLETVEISRDTEAADGSSY